MDIPQSVFRSNVLHEIEGYESIKSEYLFLLDTGRCIGGILAFSCIYFIGGFDELGIKVLFLIMSFIILVSVFLFRSVEWGDKKS